MPDVMSNLLERYIGEVKNLFGGSLRQVILYGSYARGDYREDSDVDVVIEYQGEIREDVFFDMLHENGLSVGGMMVDINPITEDKTGPLAEYLESAEQFLQEKMQEKKLEKRSVREKIKLAKQVPQKREKAKLEKSKNTERKHEDYLNR